VAVVGRPASPRGWLITVASRRLVDDLRADSARARARRTSPRRPRSSGPGGRRAHRDSDDTLTLLFLCCHPSLSGPSQLALTLRAVAG